MPSPRPLRRTAASIEPLTGSAEAAVFMALKRDSSVRVTVVGGGMDAAAHTFFTPLAAPSLI
jgi:hypothetical protein